MNKKALKNDQIRWTGMSKKEKYKCLTNMFKRCKPISHQENSSWRRCNFLQSDSTIVLLLLLCDY